MKYTFRTGIETLLAPLSTFLFYYSGNCLNMKHEIFSSETQQSSPQRRNVRLTKEQKRKFARRQADRFQTFIVDFYAKSQRGRRVKQQSSIFLRIPLFTRFPFARRFYLRCDKVRLNRRVSLLTRHTGVRISSIFQSKNPQRIATAIEIGAS